ncbi:MAG: type II toxin-antitoxin system VapC family toxin [Sandarakinorhabdus sp.]|nr:type II toxin-antitoxin system VapC family toxin [Sandarakinorhabdus sp.]
MSFYLDTSVIVPLFVDEPSAAAIAALLAETAVPLMVTEFAAGEFASALSRLVWTGRLPARIARGCLDDFDGWRVVHSLSPPVDPVDIRLAGLFVRRFDLKLRLPDAIHAATAQRLGATMVTFDRRLADAAAALGIAVTVPS